MTVIRTVTRRAEKLSAALERIRGIGLEHAADVVEAELRDMEHVLAAMRPMAFHADQCAARDQETPEFLIPERCDCLLNEARRVLAVLCRAGVVEHGYRPWGRHEGAQRLHRGCERCGHIQYADEIPVQDMVLHCPQCGQQHLDVGEFAERPHRTHRCENTPAGLNTGCGHEWRPREHYTRGVSG